MIMHNATFLYNYYYHANSWVSFISLPSFKGLEAICAKPAVTARTLDRTGGKIFCAISTLHRQEIFDSAFVQENNRTFSCKN